MKREVMEESFFTTEDSEDTEGHLSTDVKKQFSTPMFPRDPRVLRGERLLMLIRGAQRIRSLNCGPIWRRRRRRLVFRRAMLRRVQCSS